MRLTIICSFLTPSIMAGDSPLNTKNCKFRQLDDDNIFSIVIARVLLSLRCTKFSKKYKSVIKKLKISKSLFDSLITISINSFL